MNGVVRKGFELSMPYTSKSVLSQNMAAVSRARVVSVGSPKKYGSLGLLHMSSLVCRSEPNMVQHDVYHHPISVTSRHIDRSRPRSHGGGKSIHEKNCSRHFLEAVSDCLCCLQMAN